MMSLITLVSGSCPAWTENVGNGFLFSFSVQFHCFNILQTLQSVRNLFSTWVFWEFGLTTLSEFAGKVTEKKLLGIKFFNVFAFCFEFFDGNEIYHEQARFQFYDVKIAVVFRSYCAKTVRFRRKMFKTCFEGVFRSKTLWLNLFFNFQSLELFSKVLSFEMCVCVFLPWFSNWLPFLPNQLFPKKICLGGKYRSVTARLVYTSI